MSIRKHIFTVRWERVGTKAYPTFERYTCCDWPDDVLPNDAIVPTAALLDLTKIEMERKLTSLLPQDCQEALAMLQGMFARCRYSTETKGPFILDDPDHVIDEDTLLMWVAHTTEKELNKLHARNRR